MNPADILTAAADRLEKPGAWTQKAYARDGKGEPVGASSCDAVCWCVGGSVALEAGDYDLTDDALTLLTGVIGGGSFIVWNDHPNRTQAEIVQALRQAAKGAGE